MRPMLVSRVLDFLLELGLQHSPVVAWWWIASGAFETNYQTYSSTGCGSGIGDRGDFADHLNLVFHSQLVGLFVGLKPSLLGLTTNQSHDAQDHQTERGGANTGRVPNRFALAHGLTPECGRPSQGRSGPHA